jgi:hypothetical protein
MLTDAQFEDVYEKYRDHTIRLFIKSGFDEFTAEDISQDLFELMLRYRHNYNPKYPPNSFWYLTLQYVFAWVVPRYRNANIAEPMGDVSTHPEVQAIPDLNIDPEHSMDVVMFIRSLPKIMQHEIGYDAAGFENMQDRYAAYEADDKPVSCTMYKKALAKLRRDPHFQGVVRDFVGG